MVLKRGSFLCESFENSKYIPRENEKKGGDGVLSCWFLSFSISVKFYSRVILLLGTGQSVEKEYFLYKIKFSK